MGLREALEESLGALATGPQHSALIEVCRGLADYLDSAPFDDKAWREYRLSLGSLMEVAGGGSDDFAELVAELRTEVRDTADAGS